MLQNCFVRNKQHIELKISRKEPKNCKCILYQSYTQNLRYTQDTYNQYFAHDFFLMFK